jgi:hypothetical protein
MVSKKWVRAWEDAYREYGAVSEMAAGSPTVDETTAAKLAHASWAVASAWRFIGSDCELAWWVLAAVESAAEAFEDQARHWETSRLPSVSRGGPSRPASVPRFLPSSSKVRLTTAAIRTGGYAGG